MNRPPHNWTAQTVACLLTLLLGILIAYTTIVRPLREDLNRTNEQLRVAADDLRSLTQTVNHNAAALNSLADTVNYNAHIANLNTLH